MEIWFKLATEPAIKGAIPAVRCMSIAYIATHAETPYRTDLPLPSSPVGGPLLKFVSSKKVSPPFFQFLVWPPYWKFSLSEPLIWVTTSPIYDNLGINNQTSKLMPLHILPHAILVPAERCFVSPARRPRQRDWQSSNLFRLVYTELECAHVVKGGRSAHVTT